MNHSVFSRTARNHGRILAAALVAASVLSPTPSGGQTSPSPEAKTPLAFEVATIKRSDPAALGNGGGIRPLPGGETYVATGVPLRLMIKLMYRISDEQIVGGPDWMNTERYDVRAKAEHPSSVEDLHVMFQTLLADRFQLQFHREQRSLPAYVLTVDKAGSKMKVNPSAEPFEIPIKLTSGGQPPAPPKFTAIHADMKYFCWFLGQGGARFGLVDRPVVDNTGLTGFYDFTLEFAPDLSGLRGPNGETPPTFDGPTIFTALREQLGLKLESTKGEVEVFVIDRVEKPTEN